MIARRIIFIGFLIASAGCGLWNDVSKEKFSGTLELNEHVLGAKAAGRVMSLNVDEGSEIKKGDLLATLDRYVQTKKDYERAVELFKQGGGNRQTIEYAQLAMEDQAIIAPVDGVVLVKVHDAGEVVGAGSAVVVVGDRARYWVRIFIPEGMINRVRMGQPAKIKFDGLSQSLDGHVSFISSKAEFTPRNVQTAEERITQMFAVKVDIEHPPEFLRPGVACDVTIKMEIDRNNKLGN